MSYGSPFSNSRLPSGIQQNLVSGSNEIHCQSANNAALDQARPLKPHTWDSTRDVATSVSASPPYNTQRTLQPPDDQTMYSYAADSTSASFEKATNAQLGLLCQDHSDLPRPLGQSQINYVDPSSLFLNPDPSLIDVHQCLRSAIADNGWQSAYQPVPAAHPHLSRSNAMPLKAATAAMPSALALGHRSRPVFGFSDADSQQQVGPQPVPASRSTQFVSYIPPPEVGNNVALTPTANHRPASGLPDNSRPQYMKSAR